MKYFRIFRNTEEYIEYMETAGAVVPNISYCSEDNKTYITPSDVPPPTPLYRWYAVDINEEWVCSGDNKYYKEIYQVSYDGGDTWENVSPEQTRAGELYEAESEDCIDFSEKYFTIESLEDSNTISLFRYNSTTTLGNTEYYSTDKGLTWTEIPSGSGTVSIVTLDNGETVSIKAIISGGTQAKWAVDYNKNNYFNTTKQFKIYGNAMSLLVGDDFATADTITQTFALCGIFYGGNNPSNLLSAKNLVLPATGLTVSSYNGMFRGCTSLQYGPAVLPALTIHQDTYASMFEGCRSLVDAPEIKATSGSGTCMARMFCMDRGSSAVSAAMTKGPVLRIANLNSQNAYRDLFRCNGNITEVTILATNLLTSGSSPALNSWLLGVPATGVIKKLSALTTMPTGSSSGVPIGWTTQDID